MGKARVIGIISIKGGVGKTTTVSSLASALANEYGKKVLVIDGNFAAPNLGLHLGYIEPEITIHDVLNDKVKASEAIHNSDHGFHVIAGSLLGDEVDVLKLKDKIKHLKKDYDFIILDSSNNLDDQLLSVMNSADELLCIATPDYPTLSCTMRAIKLSKEHGTPIKGLILNRVRNKNFELSLDEIEDCAGCNVVAILPDEIKVLKALSETTPVTLHSPSAETSHEFRKLAACLTGQKHNDNRIKTMFSDIFRKHPKKLDINRGILIEDYK